MAAYLLLLASSWDFTRSGQLGDSFGPIAGLANAVALIIALRSLALQRAELRLQRQEMRLQREEMKSSRQELALQRTQLERSAAAEEELAKSQADLATAQQLANDFEVLRVVMDSRDKVATAQFDAARNLLLIRARDVLEKARKEAVERGDGRFEHGG